MAIKHASQISTASSTKFRSLQDVDKLLLQVKEKLDSLDSLLRNYQTQFAKQEVKSALEFKINSEPTTSPKVFKVSKIEKIVIPRLDTLKSNFALAEELSDTIASLDAVYNNVAVNFRSIRGTNDVLKKIKTMRASAETKFTRALEFLNTVGEKYAPSQFKTLVQSTMDYLITVLDYKTSLNYLYGYENKEGCLCFTYYVKLKQLVADNGEQYPEFFLVFTCVLKPESGNKGSLIASYFVTVLNTFATPGKFSLGKNVGTQAEASGAIGNLLEMENIANSIGVIPHNVSPDKVNKNRFKDSSKIARIIVEPTAFTFELLKNVKKLEANSIISNLYLDIKGLLTGVKDANIKVKITSQEGRFIIRFTLNNLAKEDQISTNDLDWLQERFNLSDDKLRKIVREING
jgi:hypothetical protein